MFVNKFTLAKRDVTWEVHLNLSNDSEAAKRLKENFSCMPLSKVCSTRKRIWKILEASKIVLKRPSLNKQVEYKNLLLFRNSLTRELHL